MDSPECKITQAWRLSHQEKCGSLTVWMVQPTPSRLPPESDTIVHLLMTGYLWNPQILAMGSDLSGKAFRKVPPLVFASYSSFFQDQSLEYMHLISEFQVTELNSRSRARKVSFPSHLRSFFLNIESPLDIRKLFKMCSMAKETKANVHDHCIPST